MLRSTRYLAVLLFGVCISACGGSGFEPASTEKGPAPASDAGAADSAPTMTADAGVVLPWADGGLDFDALPDGCTAYDKGAATCVPGVLPPGCDLVAPCAEGLRCPLSRVGCPADLPDCYVVSPRDDAGHETISAGSGCVFGLALDQRCDTMPAPPNGGCSLDLKCDVSGYCVEK